MDIILGIILFIIISICAACDGDTSGLEIIFSIILAFVLLWLLSLII